MDKELQTLTDRFDCPLITGFNKVEGMKYYCLGFLFKGDSVALIKKVGGWQDGMLNGIGGKIEEGETARKAMVREFREETGAIVDVWNAKAIYIGKTWTVFIFSSWQTIYELQKVTKEKPDWYSSFEENREAQDCPMVQMMIEICKRNVVSVIFDESSYC